MPDQDLSQLERHFHEHGWIVVQLPDPAPVLAVRESLLVELRRLLSSDEVTLENYHEFAREDELHTEIQLHLTHLFREQGFNRQVMIPQAPLIQGLIGRDIDVQRNPYLRITRPNKPHDNIGYHRDTFYGSSAFEVSVIVPYTNVPAASSLSVLSGSHVRPESDFPTVRTDNPDTTITKGSPKHKLGFPYAPKVMDPATIAGVRPVPIALGEALMLTVSTVHGSELNRGGHTRWSSDIRVMNALAPVDLSARADYYEPLWRSVVTDRALAYARAQP